ncbi:MAG: hypothetical protein U0359_41320 [Byssovorax sp.]
MTDTTPSLQVAPNLYQLQGSNLHITYSTSGIDGKAHFTYQDAHQTLSFRGDEIRTQETEIGMLVSVSLRRTVDTGSTTFTVLIPTVRLDQGHSAPVSTEGITTIHRFSVIPAFNKGQTELYNVAGLRGTAQFVVF